MTRKELKVILKTFDAPIIYRGIKIPPMIGKRSKLARAIRNDLIRNLLRSNKC